MTLGINYLQPTPYGLPYGVAVSRPFYGNPAHHTLGNRLKDGDFNQILPNRVHPATRFLPREVRFPQIHPSATLRHSQVIGDVRVDRGVHIVNAYLRADEGTPYYIGPYSNIQDGVTLHGHSTQDNGRPVRANLVEVQGQGAYSIYLGQGVTLAHGAVIHGPVFIDDHTFVGFNTVIDGANLGKNVEVGANAYISGVSIPDNTAIAPGAVITKPTDISRYASSAVGMNNKIAQINSELALAYRP